MLWRFGAARACGSHLLPCMPSFGWPSLPLPVSGVRSCPVAVSHPHSAPLAPFPFPCTRCPPNPLAVSRGSVLRDLAHSPTTLWVCGLQLRAVELLLYFEETGLAFVRVIVVEIGFGRIDLDWFVAGWRW